MLMMMGWMVPSAAGLRLSSKVLHGATRAAISSCLLLTLKTNISRLKKATVLKLPSQMLGLPFPGRAGRSAGGRPGREWRSCLRSEVECVRREGSVGNGRVGSSMAVGIPEETRQGQHEQNIGGNAKTHNDTQQHQSLCH